MGSLYQRMSRQIIAFSHDVTMAAVSFVLAVVLRLGDDGFAHLVTYLLPSLALFTVVSGGVFLLVGLYRGVWRYASLNDLVNIVKAATLVILIFLPLNFLLTRLEGVPRSSMVINWFVLISLLGAPRMIYRVFKDGGWRHVLEKNAHLRIPVVLIGAGDAAEVFIREMARMRDAPYEVLATIDEKGTRAGRSVHGVPVLGPLGTLGDILRQLKKRNRMPQRLVLTKRLKREDVELVLDVADAQGASVAQLPRVSELTRSPASANLEIRPVAIEDLLGRTQTKLDRGAMRRMIEGRQILVTGAGGSIGAELVRQIATFKPARLALLDHSEYLLYKIDLELSESHPDVPRTPLLGDVRDRERTERIIAETAPDLVFHAAALKHVPIVEANPVEGVLTNVVGTRIVADACRKAGVRAMVLVSTDKAINPTNVMGASKRLAESYCQALDILERGKSGNGMRLVTVRFGNVLGSTGSVVPLFQRQLARGGPLTVTHPDVMRYFMTTAEAVELVLQAASVGIETARQEAGKIFVLNMGEPIRIVELAQQMIRLAGQRPDKDVSIVFTGLRPGEKLCEELFHSGEPLVFTDNPGLMLAAPRTSNYELLVRGLEELEALAREGRGEEARTKLMRLVPEYGSGKPLPLSDRSADGRDTDRSADRRDVAAS